MLLKIWRLIIGYVEFEIIGRFPERFLNLAYSSGINIWGQLPENGRIIACMPARGYRNIRKIAGKANVRLRITNRRGVPFYLRRNKQRAGLLVGLVMLTVLIVFLSNFVWVINIETSPSVDYTRIKTALEANGVKVGTYKGSIDVLSLERRLMQDVPELSWAAVNIVGTSVNIEIKSREFYPETEDLESPQNIKASKDGLILKMEVLNGSSTTSIGSGAAKGQLLVSGVTEDAQGNVSIVHASARIFARTTNSAEFFAPGKTLISAPTGRVYSRKRFRLLWFTTPPTPQLMPQSAYFKNDSFYSAVVNGKSLPAGFISEENYEYLPEQFTFTQEQQRENIRKKMALYEAFFMPDIIVEKREITETITDEGLTASVKYICVEDIAESEPIYVAAD